MCSVVSVALRGCVFRVLFPRIAIHPNIDCLQFACRKDDKM